MNVLANIGIIEITLMLFDYKINVYFINLDSFIRQTDVEYDGIVNVEITIEVNNEVYS